jgi:Tol biopolymer transport system component
MALPAGEYFFYFVLDNQVNGTPNLTWMDSVSVKSLSAVGHITYTYNGEVYRIQALEGAVSENISQSLQSLSPLPAGGKDSGLNISPDGKWLVLETRRFDQECADWACMAVVASDLSFGDTIRVNGDVLRQEGVPAIASGGNLVIYSYDGGTHESDLWAVRRSSTGGNWQTPVALTTASPYSMNYQPALSSDGTKVLFECTNQAYSGTGCICEVGTDGQGFRVVLTPASSPAGLPDEADLHSPDYAPDGSIVFEADWSGEQLWRLAAGATQPARITDTFGNDNSPCVLPDGSIASLWLNRAGGQGYHEIKVMTPDGGSYYMLLTDIDVLDIGLGCGN